jgi:hypothetical protein
METSIEVKSTVATVTMSITTPEDLSDFIDVVLVKVDKKLAEQEKNRNNYVIVIPERVTWKNFELIRKMYQDAGWKRVDGVYVDINNVVKGGLRLEFTR